LPTCGVVSSGLTPPVPLPSLPPVGLVADGPVGDPGLVGPVGLDDGVLVVPVVPVLGCGAVDAGSSVIGGLPFATAA
jgi:hypothetical protein